MVAYLDRSMSSISTRRSLYVAVRRKGHKEDLFCWAIYRRKTPQGVKLSEGGLPYVDQASTPLIAWYRPLDLSAQPLCLGHREENDPEPSLRPSLPSIFSSTTDSPQQRVMSHLGQFRNTPKEQKISALPPNIRHCSAAPAFNG